MMISGGHGDPIDPTPPGISCPKEIVLTIIDILQSGGLKTWDEVIEGGDLVEIEPDSGKTLKIIFDAKVIGRVFDPTIYKCITEKGHKYEGIIEDKESKTVRLVRRT